MAEPTKEGRSLTYCAFDENVRQQPLNLASIRSKSQFCPEFVRRLNTTFSKDGGYPDLFRQSPEKCLAEFVYELYQNSFEHGCWSKENRLISGLRLLHVRRHIAHSKAELVSRAKGSKSFRSTFLIYPVIVVPQGFMRLQFLTKGLGLLSVSLQLVQNMKN